MRIDPTSSDRIRLALPSQAAAKAYGPTSTAIAAKVDKLIAGTVDRAPSFDGDTARATSHAPAVLRMYTRAADLVEAAVGVRLGQAIDIRG